MFNAKRLFGYLATGTMPEMTALDEAIAREEARRGISDDLLDEMLEFLRGGYAHQSRVTRPASSTAQDAAPASLEEHDAQYHPEGYEEGDSCKFRADRAKGDGADTGVEEGQRSDVKCQAKELAKSSLSNKKRKEWGDLMRRKHPEIDSDKLLAELGKIGDRKLQGDAFRWAMKGCELPRDLEKMRQARQLADKAKVDPLSFDSPQGCIDALTGKVEIKDKPIDPDTVPELSDKKTFPMGVTTYLVQDDSQGQQAMREIINTHWGKDANPWCLLHGDGKGNLSDGTGGGYNASYYWDHYNALPKRVAFKDGKLLAFMATAEPDEPDEEILEAILYEEYGDEYENSGEDCSIFDYVREHHESEYTDLEWKALEETRNKDIEELWWDRQDRDSSGIPVGDIPVPDDKFGRWARFEIRDGKVQRIGGYRKGERGKPGYKAWLESGPLMEEVDGDGHLTSWYSDGTPENVWSDELGNLVSFFQNGQVARLIDENATGHEASMIFREDGSIEQWNDHNGYGTWIGTGEDQPEADQDVKAALLAYLPKAKELFKKYDRRGDRDTQDADSIGHHADGSPCFTACCRRRGGIPWENIRKHNAKEKAQMKLNFNPERKGSVPSDADRLAAFRQKLRAMGIDDLCEAMRKHEDDQTSPEYKAVEAEIARRSNDHYDNLGERA